jgi:DNA mismatch repair protein MutS
MTMSSDLTPLMRQYRELKQRYPHTFLFFRVGDFYEMFYEDAVEGARLLEIALTSRDKNKTEQVPLCGVPYHAAAGYLDKLLKAGRSVALCEQVEDPRLAKGLVRREVVRVYTPGTLIESNLLTAGEPNFLAALSLISGGVGLAWLDLSTGEFRALELSDSWEERLADELLRIEPRELLVPDDQVERVRRLFGAIVPTMTSAETAVFEEAAAREFLIEHFRVASLAGFGCAEKPLAVRAAGALLNYVKQTQPGVPLSHIVRLTIHGAGPIMALDRATQRNLELVRRALDGRVEGSLLGALDRTMTSMGARLLRDWILHPLTDIAPILDRQEAVAELHADFERRSRLRTAMKSISDIERLMTRIVLGAANARDLLALKNSLKALPQINQQLSVCTAPFLKSRHEQWDDLADLALTIERAIEPDASAAVKEGELIREGYHPALDELKVISREGKAWIAGLERQERENTGIASLKIRYNQVFGYYIEITKANLGRVPLHYARKQTLANAERFTTQELKTLEDKVMGAEERIRTLEFELFDALRRQVATASHRVQKLAQTVAAVDVVTGLSLVASENAYCRPELTSDDRLVIKDGRHPVLEQERLAGGFIPNDVQLGGPTHRLLVITGPNMAGKSTYLRQTALIVLLAQIGSFVPAKAAAIGAVDRIFTRVGASDNLLEGQSTFMVEMTETANILHHATARSLILLDEIGRGTSTFDGLSIAWAVAEALADTSRVGARTLFATHYHELTELAHTHPGVRNYNVAVRERGDEILFLRKIVPGGSDRSYGIQVARLAGLPRDVIARAQDVLASLETGMRHEDKNQEGPCEHEPDIDPTIDPTLPAAHPILDEVRQMDLFKMTPLDALNKLSEMKERLQQEEAG